MSDPHQNPYPEQQPPASGYGYPQQPSPQPGTPPPYGTQPPYGADPYGQQYGGQPYGDPQFGQQYGQQFAGQPGYGYPGQPGAMPVPYGYDPAAPYGYDPYGRPYSDKSRIVAGVLTLFAGGFGIGRFYTGHVGIALAQLFTCGGLGFWALIDGIITLTNKDATDSEGRVLRGG
ncbi:TM2 domain-containing protein [Streptomyces sp. RKND-216]|uniref:TM2 domain-containing protein n=1 Tax=Streptomyces sp. RKND-216 TaxID=2562581 RepID=UPI00109E14BB|nr:TM2 domain-containing protein [Streptomyces sp. RKND-216]THA26764.1 TM2 domain-containing protein [Streptomyces sp. RKND-216]